MCADVSAGRTKLKEAAEKACAEHGGAFGAFSVKGTTGIVCMDDSKVPLDRKDFLRAAGDGEFGDMLGVFPH